MTRKTLADNLCYEVPHIFTDNDTLKIDAGHVNNGYTIDLSNNIDTVRTQLENQRVEVTQKSYGLSVVGYAGWYKLLARDTDRVQEIVVKDGTGERLGVLDLERVPPAVPAHREFEMKWCSHDDGYGRFGGRDWTGVGSAVQDEQATVVAGYAEFPDGFQVRVCEGDWVFDTDGERCGVDGYQNGDIAQFGPYEEEYQATRAVSLFMNAVQYGLIWDSYQQENELNQVVREVAKGVEENREQIEKGVSGKTNVVV